MAAIHFILIALAVVCLVLKAIGVTGKVDLWPLAWAFFLASFLSTGA